MLEFSRELGDAPASIGSQNFVMEAQHLVSSLAQCLSKASIDIVAPLQLNWCVCFGTNYWQQCAFSPCFFTSYCAELRRGTLHGAFWTVEQVPFG